MFPNPIIKIGSLEIYLYGVCIAIGIVCAILVLRLYGKKLGLDKKFLDFIEMDGYAAIALGFFFATLFQAVYNYIDDPSGGFSLKGGMTFLGGLIGGALVFFIIYFLFIKKYTLRFKDIMPIVPCSILVAHGFGRIGCFCAGCCYGKQVPDGVWYSFLGVEFPDIYGKVLPTQLFEAAFLFILFGILSYLCLKKKGRQNFGIYLIAYGIWRFLIEFIRGDYRGELVGFVTPSQFWSILMTLGGVALIFVTKFVLFKDDKKNELVKEEIKETKVEEPQEVEEAQPVEEVQEVEEPAEPTLDESDIDKEIDDITNEDIEDLEALDEVEEPQPVEEVQVEEPKKIEEEKLSEDDKYRERMRRQLLAQKKLRDEETLTPKKSSSLEEKLGKKKE